MAVQSGSNNKNRNGNSPRTRVATATTVRIKAYTRSDGTYVPTHYRNRNGNSPRSRTAVGSIRKKNTAPKKSTYKKPFAWLPTTGLRRDAIKLSKAYNKQSQKIGRQWDNFTDITSAMGGAFVDAFKPEPLKRPAKNKTAPSNNKTPTPSNKPPTAKEVERELARVGKEVRDFTKQVKSKKDKTMLAAELLSWFPHAVVWVPHIAVEVINEVGDYYNDKQWKRIEREWSKAKMLGKQPNITHLPAVPPKQPRVRKKPQKFDKRALAKQQTNILREWNKSRKLGKNLTGSSFYETNQGEAERIESLGNTLMAADNRRAKASAARRNKPIGVALSRYARNRKNKISNTWYKPDAVGKKQFPAITGPWSNRAVAEHKRNNPVNWRNRNKNQSQIRIAQANKKKRGVV